MILPVYKPTFFCLGGNAHCVFAARILECVANILKEILIRFCDREMSPKAILSFFRKQFLGLVVKTNVVLLVWVWASDSEFRPTLPNICNMTFLIPLVSSYSMFNLKPLCVLIATLTGPPRKGKESPWSKVGSSLWP